MKLIIFLRIYVVTSCLITLTHKLNFFFQNRNCDKWILLFLHAEQENEVLFHYPYTWDIVERYEFFKVTKFSNILKYTECSFIHFQYSPFILLITYKNSITITDKMFLKRFVTTNFIFYFWIQQLLFFYYGKVFSS